MTFLADLHIHSRFSRATSPSLDLEHLDLWARKKGLAVVGTGDFTHPGWFSELRKHLVDAEEGLFTLKEDLRASVDTLLPPSCPGPTRFLLSGEISCIYKKLGKTRKAHHLILMPDMGAVERFNARLGRIGNIASDGRPILGLDSRDLLEITLDTTEDAFFIPAHVWTPWFSVFGSKSGFDTLEECFGDLTGHIHALETGLSSDPPMNRCLSALDGYLLVSNSDAHSPAKLGREANVFDTPLGYSPMIRAMTDGRGFSGTVEFFPQEGKYHLDGHRKCGVRLHPEETARRDGVCPVCGKPLTVGVLNRIYRMSDRETPLLTKEFFSLIPLPEILSELLSCGPATRKVEAVYERLLRQLGPELHILLHAPPEQIEAAGGPALAEAVGRMRRREVLCQEGYDGDYGIIRLFHASERAAVSGQMGLFKPAAETVGPLPRPVRPVVGARTEGPSHSPLPAPEISDPVLDPLNPEQRSAVVHGRGPLLVTAGPGTGKTMTLAHRIAHLVRDGAASPDRILALTFTRKAAREMEHRIGTLVEHLSGERVKVKTFHRFCLEALRDHCGAAGLPPGFTLCSEWDADACAREILSRAGVDARTVRRFPAELPRIRKATLGGGSPGDIPPGLARLYQCYRDGMRAFSMLTLDELEAQTLELFRTRREIPGSYADRFPWIFIDEYQDTNPFQVELLKTVVHCSPESVHLCAIGDPDQAIYGFRGAEVSGFHRFSEDFPGTVTVRLTRNYRSTRPILSGAASLLGTDPLTSLERDGSPIARASCTTPEEEAEMVVEQVERLMGGTSHFSLDSGRVASHQGDHSLGFCDIAVLYRLNSQGHCIEEAFQRAGIPYLRSGEVPLVARFPVNVLWRFFQTLLYPDHPIYTARYEDLADDERVRRSPPTTTFDAAGTLPDLLDRAVAFLDLDCSSEESEAALEGLRRISTEFRGDLSSFLDELSLERGIDHRFLEGDRVALMSLHAAKGLEWPAVFIVGCEERLMPCTLFGHTDEDEERRLLYVGMTRARARLTLSHARGRTLNGRTLVTGPSPFLAAVDPHSIAPLERAPWRRRSPPQTQLELF